MTTHRHVVILGASLLLAALADHLERQPGLTVTRVNPHLQDALQRVLACVPDVILVDREQADDRRGERAVLDVLYALPGVPVMGIDSAGHTTTVLVGNRVETEQISDLVQMIMSQ